jgi:nicotinamide riboside transporter PnuC
MDSNFLLESSISNYTENFVAGCIYVFGSLGLFLVVLKNKWGFVIGLIGQLFFTIAAYFDRQNGLFVYSIILTLIWIFGIYSWIYKDSESL